MDRIEKALELRSKMYNCCQAVVCTFADVAGVEEQVLFKIAEGFGSGMGGQQCVCGAVAGAVMVSGLLKSSGQAGNIDSLLKSLERSRQLTEGFEQKNTSLVCKDLKLTDAEKSYAICNGYVVEAVKLVEEIILNNEKEGVENV